nr:MAG: putative NADH-flavin reductase [Candidatus Nanosalinarum sp. J07AB56]
MRIAVFGANGKTGRRLVDQALKRGHEVVGFDIGFDEDFPSSAEKILGDVHDEAKVEEAVGRSDAVVSALGVTKRSGEDVVSTGVKNISKAMRENGVDRLVVLTGAGATLESESETLGNRLVDVLLRFVMPGALEDGRRMVRGLQDSELDWTVVRAPRLKDSDGDRDYSLGRTSGWD